MRLNAETITLNMYSDPADESENDTSDSIRSTSTSTGNSYSIHSTSTSARSGRMKQRKKRGEGVENQKRVSNIREEDARLIQEMIEDDESVHSKMNESGRQPWNKKIPTAAAIMDALEVDIEVMELEHEKLLEELETVEREKKEQLRAARRKQEGGDQEFLVGRITELEVENKILKTRLQSGHATVDEIRNDIASVVTSNHDVKKALKEAKSNAKTLQDEQESLRLKLQQAETDTKALEEKTSFKRTVRSLKEEQKTVFEQATREILDLQRSNKLKKQHSQRKLQQRQQKYKSVMQNSHIEEYLQKQEKQQTSKQKQRKGRRSMARQNSWWQLGSPETAPKPSVSAIEFTSTPEVNPKRSVRSLIYEKTFDAINTTASEDSDIDTV